ncbi:SCO1/SenC-domain-containing protein [Lineolata rhizophorae]|uniref:SCO1/SenC-domain-containing protein n=1 Tax=Lineolata rhizophorae TaxID=578093 RepID=A0A6A6P988_9PEZI|nr:SCO1/SenC-domain-containing protein [Lineolata rhizophorae]
MPRPAPSVASTARALRPGGATRRAFDNSNPILRRPAPPDESRQLYHSSSRTISNRAVFQAPTPVFAGAQREFVSCRNVQRGNFSTSQRRCRAFKTVQEADSRHRGGGPFSWKAGLIFIITGACLSIYFQAEKARMERKRIAEHTKGVGKPKVGGPFNLIDTNGKPFTHENLKGKYSLIYFGFTHCPDICPDELDKMATMYDLVKQNMGNVIRPVFISADPARDTPQVLRTYLDEFHPEFIGLTGEYEEVKATCKAYRVYFSTPEGVKPGQDYLVDHSIYFYLMDPEGDFVEVLGRNFTAEQAAKVIMDHIKDWKGPLDKN